MDIAIPLTAMAPHHSFRVKSSGHEQINYHHSWYHLDPTERQALGNQGLQNRKSRPSQTTVWDEVSTAADLRRVHTNCTLTSWRLLLILRMGEELNLDTFFGGQGRDRRGTVRCLHSSLFLPSSKNAVERVGHKLHKHTHTEAQVWSPNIVGYLRVAPQSQVCSLKAEKIIRSVNLWPRLIYNMQQGTLSLGVANYASSEHPKCVPKSEVQWQYVREQ